MFICPLCGKIFQAREILQSHIFSHTKEKPHKCPTCSLTFPRLGSLTEHIKYIHNGNKIQSFQCPECNYKSHARGQLKRHLRTHSAELPFSCTVPSCSFKTKHRGCLARHVRGVHSSDLPYECKSDGCNYKTSKKDNLHRHLKTHSNERPFACKVQGCNYTCKTKYCLQIHTRGFHSDKKRWKCSKCDFRTKHNSYLKAHQATHSSTKNFQCKAPNCRYASNTKMDLVMHFDRKHRKKEIFCTELGCRYRCGSTALLKIHLKDHKLPILKCPDGSCDFSARSKTNLRAHLARHHGNKHGVSLLVSRQLDRLNAGPTATVETRHCLFPNCGYRTDLPHRYDRHIMTHDHNDQRKLVCQFCSCTFTRLRNLETHIQRHIGEKPHRCSQCDYTCVEGASLRHHAQRVHRIFVIPLGNENTFEKKCQTCDLNFTSYSEFMLHSMTHLKPIVVLERLSIQNI